METWWRTGHKLKVRKGFESTLKGGSYSHHLLATNSYDKDNPLRASIISVTPPLNWRVIRIKKEKRLLSPHFLFVCEESDFQEDWVGKVFSREEIKIFSKYLKFGLFAKNRFVSAGDFKEVYG